MLERAGSQPAGWGWEHHAIGFPKDYSIGIPTRRKRWWWEPGGNSELMTENKIILKRLVKIEEGKCNM
jgi:hypothetical protein